MRLTVLPCPWVHGGNRLITCLRWMMSLCWQLISGLWTQTCSSWPRLALDDPSFRFFHIFVCATFLELKKCSKVEPLFPDGPGYLPQGIASVFSPSSSLHLVFASDLIYWYCSQGYLTCLLKNGLDAPQVWQEWTCAKWGQRQCVVVR